MKRNAENPADPARAETRPARSAGRGTQSIQRASLLLRLLASRSHAGMRLSEVVKDSELEHPTVHRMLKGLMAEGLVMQDPMTRCYLLGPLVFELGLAAAPQFNLPDIFRPSLARIADKSGDTVFLTARSGNDSVCLDRKEGSFPIKTFTLEVGARRPLGAGAGGLALLMLLPEQVVDKIVRTNAGRFGSYNNLTVPLLLRALDRSRKLGYALNDTHNTAGAVTLGLPCVNRYGDPFAAISIGAISSRMTEERQKELVSILRKEVRVIETAMREATRPQAFRVGFPISGMFNHGSKA
ncbi:MAG: IclR family transcriptional regulator [Betaproteobacteria bacterium RIFCSPLOWO2_02_FULL_63_19]|nr:MAG: IclR family transcriptional regulator [Betaproteobacteria bacterium RIFCSPLOWO2_02_FULL_63_19]